MAEPPKETQQARQPQRLSDRIENHRKEVQYLIKQGGEHPQYEFKRAVSLSRENLDDRLDFVKLMQAVANAEIATERCIVIGADPKEKKFYSVTNTDDFDPANVLVSWACEVFGAILRKANLRVCNVAANSIGAEC